MQEKEFYQLEEINLNKKIYINKAKENLEIPKDIVLKIEEILLLIKNDNEGDALELFYNLLHDYKYQKINSDY